MDRIFIFQQDFITLDQMILKNIVSSQSIINLDKVRQIPFEDIEAYAKYVTASQPDKLFVPVGSPSFVKMWLKLYLGKDVMTTFILPNELRAFGYIRRSYDIVSGPEVLARPSYWNYYIKDTSYPRSWNNLLLIGVKSQGFYESNIFKDKTYIVSDKLTFTSEWRAFVLFGDVVGCYRYVGDTTVFPDGDFIKSIVDVIENSEKEKYPSAYALDVGVTDKGDTVLISMKPFISCELFGFSDEKLIPKMLDYGYRYYIGGE